MGGGGAAAARPPAGAAVAHRRIAAAATSGAPRWWSFCGSRRRLAAPRCSSRPARSLARRPRERRRPDLRGGSAIALSRGVAPTDFLLDTPGVELLRSTPAFPVRCLWASTLPPTVDEETRMRRTVPLALLLLGLLGRGVAAAQPAAGGPGPANDPRSAMTLSAATSIRPSGARARPRSSPHRRSAQSHPQRVHDMQKRFLDLKFDLEGAHRDREPGCCSRAGGRGEVWPPSTGCSPSRARSRRRSCRC